MISVTADQLSAAAAYLTRTWGVCGYWFTGIESPSLYVSVFRVRCGDGSGFVIVADRWGNCRELVAEMHAAAAAP